MGVVGIMTKPDSPQDLPTNSAWFEFNGTDATNVLCKSTLTSESEETEVIIPYGCSSSDMLRYRIEVSQEYVQFSISGIVVATHYNLIPSPYSALNLCCGWINNDVTSSSSVMSIDTIFVNNANILQVQGGFSGLPLKVSSEPTAIKDAQTNREIQLASNRELRVTDSERVCGGAFEGSTMDTNMWASTSSNNASNTASNLEFCSSSGTTSGALAVLKSNNVARYKLGYQNILGCAIRFSAGVTGNRRRFGVFDTGRNNGLFFYLDGTTFGVGCVKGGAQTLVPNGNFNGNMGSSYALDTNYHTFEIVYGLTSIDFYIDGELLQRLVGASTTLVNTLLFYITVENFSSTATQQSAYIYSSMMVVQCLSSHDTQPLCSVIETSGTFVLKIGCGKLRRIINVDNVGTCTLYDNTAGNGKKLTPTFDCARVVGTIEIGNYFDTGLTLVTAGSPKLLIIYE
jgi:hypothetical protein